MRLGPAHDGRFDELDQYGPNEYRSSRMATGSHHFGSGAAHLARRSRGGSGDRARQDSAIGGDPRHRINHQGRYRARHVVSSSLASGRRHEQLLSRACRRRASWGNPRWRRRFDAVRREIDRPISRDRGRGALGERRSATRARSCVQRGGSCSDNQISCCPPPPYNSPLVHRIRQIVRCRPARYRSPACPHADRLNYLTESEPASSANWRRPSVWWRATAKACGQERWPQPGRPSRQ